MSDEKVKTIDDNITSIISNYLAVNEGERYQYAKELKKFYTSVPFQKNKTALTRVT